MQYPKRLARSCLVAISLMSLVVLALAGCGGGSSTSGASGPVRGGTITGSLDSDVVTLDPVPSTALVDRMVMLNMYDTIVRVDTHNVVQPDLATKWDYTNPTTLVFTLRTDVKFQDGTPFNADAVVFNINRILNAKSSPRKSEISTVTSVTAVDPTHVQFNLSKAFAPLLAALTDRAGMILSPTAVQAAGADVANKPVGMGSGPFEFSEWVKGDHLTLKRNPTYWGKDSSGGALPYLDAVTYKPITNTSVVYQNLVANNIQIAFRGISPQDVASAKANSSLTYKTIAGLSFAGFELNVKSAPLTDVHVRRAIAWAMNAPEIIHTVLLDNAVLSNGPIPPSSWAYDASFTPYHNDVNQAKSELSQASTQSPTFNLLIVAGDPTTATLAQFIQSSLKTAGITVNLVPETFAKILSDTQAESYQAALIGWSGRPDPDGNMYSWFHTGGGNNQMQYSNATADQMLDDARVQSDQATRAKDYQQAQQAIMQDAPYIFIDHGLATQVSSNKVQNFTIAPTTIPDMSQVWLSH